MFKNVVSKRVNTNHLRNMASLKQKHSTAKFLNFTSIQKADYIENLSKTLVVEQNFGATKKKLGAPHVNFSLRHKVTFSNAQNLPRILVAFRKASNINESSVFGSAKQQ